MSVFVCYRGNRDTMGTIESDIDWSDREVGSLGSEHSFDSDCELTSSNEDRETECTNNAFVNAEDSQNCRPDGVDSDLDQDDSASLFYGIDMADSVAVKLGDLIRRGKVDKSRILYKLRSST